MWFTHGHNFSYVPFGYSEPVTLFPVVWDIRTAAALLSEWHRLYDPDRLNPVYAIIDEAAESGINTVIIRSELGDKWFPEEPGTYGDKFFPLAGAAREAGLHVMPGGISTALDQAEQDQAVVDYLKLYIAMTEGDYPGEVIGFFGFDEPDVKYLENPGQQQQWLEHVSYWGDVCRSELNLPVMSYLAKFGTVDETGYVQYFSDTTCVLNRMARFTDMVAIDTYPATNNFRRTDLLETETGNALYTCATDLVQDDPLHVEAMNGRDELIRVFAEGDSARVLVESIAWDGVDLHLETAASITLSFFPDRFASSDFRAGFAIQEYPGYVNSGVVLWDHTEPVDRVAVISSVEGQPRLSYLPDFHGSEDLLPVFIAVGQTDYWADALGVQGIIGRGRLAVLTGLQDSSGKLWLMLYTLSRPGSSWDLQPAFDQPRKLYFPASGAVWGTFWGRWYEFGTIQPVARNGFIIHDEDGNYITLNQLSRSYWQLYPAYGVSQYQELFGSEVMPDFLRICRIDGDYPPFFAGRDQLVGFFSEQSRIVATSSLFSGGSMTETEIIEVTGLSGQVTGFDLFRNDHRYSDRPVFTMESGEVRSGVGSMETGALSGEIATEPVRYCSGDTVIAGVRAMYSRDAIRSALVRSGEGFYLPHSELYSDVFDHWRFQWYPNAYRTGLNIAVESTARSNCLFAVIQSFGRRGFALPYYSPSPDSMLYMVTSPIVEGARGVVFYALDLAMMSGNGGDDGISRAPFVLQNWGPSRDQGNTDMIGTVHETVSSLTGRGIYRVDYLAALTNTTWSVLDDSRAHNLDPADSLLDFIALENAAADTVLLLAVNQATSASPFTQGIVFEDLPPGFRITDSHGWQPGHLTLEIHPDGSTVTQLDYSSIPPLTASVLTLTSEEGGYCQGNVLETATCSSGTTTVSFSVCRTESGELSLYDVCGRRISTLWQGTGDGTPFYAVIQRSDQPAGLYFVVLETGTVMLAGKCFLW